MPQYTVSDIFLALNPQVRAADFILTMSEIADAKPEAVTLQIDVWKPSGTSPANFAGGEAPCYAMVNRVWPDGLSTVETLFAPVDRIDSLVKWYVDSLRIRGIDVSIQDRADS